MCGKPAGIALTIKCRHGQGKPAAAKKMTGDCGNMPLCDLSVLAINQPGGGQLLGRGFQEYQRMVTAIRLHYGDDTAEPQVIFEHLAHCGRQGIGRHGGKWAEPRARGTQSLERQWVKKRVFRHRMKTQPLVQLAGFGGRGEVGKQLFLGGGGHLQHARCEPPARRLDIPAGQVGDNPAGFGQAAFDRQQNALRVLTLHQQLPDRTKFPTRMVVADKRQPAGPEDLAFFGETFRQKGNGGGAVSVVNRYDFQGSLSAIWR